jgi:predicted kinase
MATLVIMRGLPGCGKSTYARKWVSEDPDGRAEVNRDAIRLMLGGYVVGSSAQEKMVTKVQHQAIKDLLISGVDVVSSDTNLTERYVRELFKIANSVGAEIYVHDMTNIDLDTVLAQNTYRTDKEPVPYVVIMKMYQKSVKGKGYPLPLPKEDSAGKAPDFWYVDLSCIGKQPHDICDIDGTVADHAGIRSPYDYSLVGEDRERRRVSEILRDRYMMGKGLIYVSGRPDIDNVRADTEAWLRSHVGVPFAALYMRPADRLQINDAIIKRDLFDEHIRHKYNLTGVVFDDRDRVVDMWRNQLGLDCMQVNYGDF